MRIVNNRFIAIILLVSLILTSGCSNTALLEETSEALTSDATVITTAETLVETTEETEVPFKQKEITIDYYKIPDIYNSYLTEDEVALYNQFVTNWLNYEPVLEFDDANQMGNVWGMIKECFFLAYGDFNEEIGGFIVYGNCLMFNYKSQSKAEHERIIQEFEDRALSFYEGIDKSEEGLELARHIYINYNSTLDYNYDLYESGDYTFLNSSGYTALMEGSGVCSSFAKAYSFLLRQAGIEAFDTSCVDHEWTILKMDDKYYFADPTWDYYKYPEDYSYFLFGLDRREADGYYEEDMILCCNGDFLMKDYLTVEREDYYN
mgnify:CR=1 FL=1